MSHVEITDFLVYFIRRRHEDAGLSHMRIEYIFFKPEKKRKKETAAFECVSRADGWVASGGPEWNGARVSPAQFVLCVKSYVLDCYV